MAYSKAARAASRHSARYSLLSSTKAGEYHFAIVERTRTWPGGRSDTCFVVVRSKSQIARDARSLRALPACALGGGWKLRMADPETWRSSAENALEVLLRETAVAKKKRKRGHRRVPGRPQRTGRGSVRPTSGGHP